LPPLQASPVQSAAASAPLLMNTEISPLMRAEMGSLGGTAAAPREGLTARASAAVVAA
jgi:hypothetical protein